MPRGVISLLQDVEANAESQCDFCPIPHPTPPSHPHPPSSTVADKRLSLMRGTKVVAGKLLVFLSAEISFNLVSPENLFQARANSSKRKPKEIIAVCFPWGATGRINPFVMPPSTGQVHTHTVAGDRRLEGLAKISKPSCRRRVPKTELGYQEATGCSYLQGRRPWALVWGLLGSQSQATCCAPPAPSSKRTVRAARGICQGNKRGSRQELDSSGKRNMLASALIH